MDGEVLETSAYYKGYEAGLLMANLPCPYAVASRDSNEWLKGFRDGRTETRQELSSIPTHLRNFSTRALNVKLPDQAKPSYFVVEELDPDCSESWFMKFRVTCYTEIGNIIRQTVHDGENSLKIQSQIWLSLGARKRSGCEKD